MRRNGLQVSRALTGARSGDVFLLSWGNATTRAGVKELARRAASRVGLEVGLDTLREGLRLTVIGATGAGDNNSHAD